MVDVGSENEREALKMLCTGLPKTSMQKRIDTLEESVRLSRGRTRLLSLLEFKKICGIVQ